ncbi:hypothetical protein B0H13DRAFT_1933831 [Mycena leptocephala]|nr:hypothetical protein B0H13DRAFT_1933831 [Mycena leptocephala]
MTARIDTSFESGLVLKLACLVSLVHTRQHAPTARLHRSGELKRFHPTRPDTQDRRRDEEEGDGPPRTRVVDDADRCGYGDGVHTDSKALKVAIIADNFLPTIDGSTITLAHLLQLLAATHAHAMLLGSEIGMREYAGARLLGTFGVPLRVYPVFKINFISPAFLHAIHLVPHLARRAGPHRAADTVSEHSDRDEPAYESADICGDF